MMRLSNLIILNCCQETSLFKLSYCYSVLFFFVLQDKTQVYRWIVRFSSLQLRNVISHMVVLHKSLLTVLQFKSSLETCTGKVTDCLLLFYVSSWCVDTEQCCAELEDVMDKRLPGGKKWLLGDFSQLISIQSGPWWSKWTTNRNYSVIMRISVELLLYSHQGSESWSTFKSKRTCL